MVVCCISASTGGIYGFCTSTRASQETQAFMSVDCGVNGIYAYLTRADAAGTAAWQATRATATARGPAG